MWLKESPFPLPERPPVALSLLSLAVRCSFSALCRRRDRHTPDDHREQHPVPSAHGVLLEPAMHGWWPLHAGCGRSGGHVSAAGTRHRQGRDMGH